jgi:hypothetical protein
LPSNEPDFYAGLPGFILSRIEGNRTINPEKVQIISQSGLKRKLRRAESFLKG